MDTPRTTPQPTPPADAADATRAPKTQASAPRLAYAPPTITSSGIFHTVSNGPTPQLGCGTYG